MAFSLQIFQIWYSNCEQIVFYWLAWFIFLKRSPGELRPCWFTRTGSEENLKKFWRRLSSSESTFSLLIFYQLKVQKLAIFFDSFAYCLDKYLRICLIFWSSNYTPNALFFPFLILFISLVWNWSLFSFYFFSVYNWISVIYSSLPYFGKEISFMFMFLIQKI